MEQMTLSLNRHTRIGHPLIGNARVPLQRAETYKDGSTVCISATMDSQHCPRGCRCQCHSRTSIRTPTWLRSVFGQLLWSYNSSISLKSCNYPPCRKSWSKHHFTYYFPSWIVSRAVIASADLDNLFDVGAKLMVNVPLIVPEESHIVWSLVMAGNMEQLQQLLSRDRSLMHVRNQWGQSILHVRKALISFKYPACKPCFGSM